jgi:hypothetical protein
MSAAPAGRLATIRTDATPATKLFITRPHSRPSLSRNRRDNQSLQPGKGNTRAKPRYRLPLLSVRGATSVFGHSKFELD